MAHNINVLYLVATLSHKSFRHYHNLILKCRYILSFLDLKLSYNIKLITIQTSAYLCCICHSPIQLRSRLHNFRSRGCSYHYLHNVHMSFCNPFHSLMFHILANMNNSTINHNIKFNKSFCKIENGLLSVHLDPIQPSRHPPTQVPVIWSHDRGSGQC